MSSLIIKELIKFVKKKFAADKAAKAGEGEKKAESKTPVAPVAPVPPPGWTAHLDANANRYYYVETATGKTQWEAPEGTILPPPAPPAPPVAPAAPKAEGEKKPDYLKMAKDFHKKSKGGKKSHGGGEHEEHEHEEEEEEGDEGGEE